MMEWKIVPIRNEKDEITHYLAIQRDISDRRIERWVGRIDYCKLFSRVGNVTRRNCKGGAVGASPPEPANLQLRQETGRARHGRHCFL